jgi:hypothetical protein
MLEPYEFYKNVWSGFGDIRFVTLPEILISNKNQDMGQLGHGVEVCTAPSVWSHDKKTFLGNFGI